MDLFLNAQKAAINYTITLPPIKLLLFRFTGIKIYLKALIMVFLSRLILIKMNYNSLRSSQ